MCKKVFREKSPYREEFPKIYEKNLHFLYTNCQNRCFKELSTQKHTNIPTAIQSALKSKKKPYRKAKNKTTAKKNLRSIYQKQGKGGSKRNLVRRMNRK